MLRKAWDYEDIFDKIVMGNRLHKGEYDYVYCILSMANVQVLFLTGEYFPVKILLIRLTCKYDLRLI